MNDQVIYWFELLQSNNAASIQQATQEVGHEQQVLQSFCSAFRMFMTNPTLGAGKVRSVKFYEGSEEDTASDELVIRHLAERAAHQAQPHAETQIARYFLDLIIGAQGHKSTQRQITLGHVTEFPEQKHIAHSEQYAFAEPLLAFALLHAKLPDDVMMTFQASPAHEPIVLLRAC